MAQLGFDISALFASAGKFVKASAPKLAESAIARRIAKDNAKTASYVAQAQAPVYTEPQQPIYAAPQSGTGFDMNQLIKPAALLVAGLISVKALQKISNKQDKK